jgi:hypothetical protein
MIVINATNEHAQFCGVERTIHIKDGANFLFPRLLTPWCKPETKPISFFDGPFTFEWVNGKAIVA